MNGRQGHITPIPPTKAEILPHYSLFSQLPLPEPLHRVGMRPENAADGDKALLNGKLIYRFHTSPIKIPVDIFAEIDKLNLEC